VNRAEITIGIVGFVVGVLGWLFCEVIFSSKETADERIEHIRASWPVFFIAFCIAFAAVLSFRIFVEGK
jgi:hypothetical protein